MANNLLSATTVPLYVAVPLFVVLGAGFLALFFWFYFRLIWDLRLSFKRGESSGEIWLPKDTFDLKKDTVCIEADPNKKDFVILTLADIQVHDRFRLDKHRVIYNTIEGAIKKAKPDLIVLLGDNCWGYSRQCYKRLVAIMDGFGVPWAPVFGNHDCEGNADIAYLSNILGKGKHCLFRPGPRTVTGVGNYAINVVKSGKIIHSLFLFDSGTWQIEYDEKKIVYLPADEEMKEKMPAYYAERIKEGPHAGQTQVGGNWGSLSYEQIDYYKWLLAGITKANGGIKPESSMYMHIPLREYCDAYFDWVKSGFDPAVGMGEVNEAICSGAVSTGMFDAILEEGSTKNVVVGHDHENNFSALYKGVRLSYGMKCADECSWREYMSGGSIVTVDEEGKGTFSHVYVEPKGLRHKEGFFGKIFY